MNQLTPPPRFVRNKLAIALAVLALLAALAIGALAQQPLPKWECVLVDDRGLCLVWMNLSEPPPTEEPQPPGG